MAYKFQRGPAKLSGSLVQEGSIAVHDESGNSNASISQAGAADFASTLNVDGAATMAAITMDGILSGSAAAQFGSTLTVAGAIDANSTSDFAGAMNLQAGITVAGAIDANSTSNFQGAMVLQSTIDVAGAISGSSTLAVGGASTFAGNALPDVDSTYDLGSNTKRWRNLYADNVYGDFNRDVVTMATTSDISASTDVVIGTNAAAATFTLPSMSGSQVQSGKTIVIKRSGLAGDSITVAVGAGDSFDDDEPIILETAGAAVTLVCTEDTWFII